MFSSLGLFDAVECPEGPSCELLNCIFLHSQTDDVGNAPVGWSAKSRVHDEELVEPPRKRMRKSEDNGEPVQKVRLGQAARTNGPAVSIEGPNALPGSASGSPALSKKPKPSSVQALTPKVAQPAPETKASKGHASTTASTQALSTKTAKVQTHENGPPRPQVQKARNLKAEVLAPRMLPKAPAAYKTRLQLISLLFDQVARLNSEIKNSSDDFRAALELSPQEAITYVLDEEEKIAKTQPTLYSNVLKLRIVALKKMGVKQWRAEREKQIAKDFPDVVLAKDKPEPVVIDTGLTPKEENALLPNLLTPLTGLDKQGYILTAPTESELAPARAAVEASGGWEQCDRCSSRFQVFPGRRASDGALASGGSCKYHHGKQRRPPRDMTAGKNAAIPPEQWTCCGREIGTPGCVVAPTHVFKASDPKRLALVTPFARTKGRGKRAGPAVCMDCEMGFTTRGMELIRLTATTWPSGRELVDVLVRPVGELLDLNTRFSGVTAADMTNAPPFDPAVYGTDKAAALPVKDGPLPLVSSTEAARALLLEHLTPKTPLIGHALENDLNAVRLLHSTIVDTVLLYPHPRGLPIRYGLRALVDRHLHRQIQVAGEAGHDSKEDARAAGDLVRLKVAEKWKSLRMEGWTLDAGVFNAPTGEEERGKVLDPKAKA